MKIIIARLPKAGLANKLFVWARAQVYAKQYNLPIITIGWFDLKIGPWLRGERTKRFYVGYFKRTYSLQLFFQYILFRIKGKNYFEPEVLPEYDGAYIFSVMPHWSDYFKGLGSHRDFLKEKFWGALKSNIQSRIKASEYPQVGVHIRMGDFKKLPEGIEFKNVGSTRTPLVYFKQIILLLKEKMGVNTMFTIFSDGHPDELAELTDIGGVGLAKKNPDIVDLWLLSFSKVIVTSAGSTFGYWAAFLSEAAVIHHPHFKIKTRVKASFFEGDINEFLIKEDVSNY